MVPNIKGIEVIKYLTASTILELDDLPEELLILGGGYIGLEFAQMFSRFGSKITIVDRSEQLLSREDKDVAEEIRSILEDEGITIHLNTEVEQFLNEKGQGKAKIKVNGEIKEASFSQCLLAMGVDPNTHDLNCKAANVKTDEKGYIQVNNYLETS